MLQRTRSEMLPFSITVILSDKSPASLLRTAAVDYLAKNPQVICLGTLGGEPRYTTREILALERTLLERVE